MAKPVPRVKDANVKCVLLLPCDNCDDCLSRCLAYICSTCPSGEYFQETAFAWVFLWREEKVTKIDRRREREREPQWLGIEEREALDEMDERGSRHLFLPFRAKNPVYTWSCWWFALVWSWKRHSRMDMLFYHLVSCCHVSLLQSFLLFFPSHIFTKSVLDVCICCVSCQRMPHGVGEMQSQREREDEKMLLHVGCEKDVNIKGKKWEIIWLLSHWMQKVVTSWINGQIFAMTWGRGSKRINFYLFSRSFVVVMQCCSRSCCLWYAMMVISEWSNASISFENCMPV